MKQNNLFKNRPRTYRNGANPNSIRSNISYTAKNLSGKLNVHIRTIYAWHQLGLKPIDSSLPYMYYGNAVKAFLKAMKQTKKRPCGEFEFYCLKCKASKAPCRNKLYYKKHNQFIYHLMSNCIDCHTKINKFIRLKDINKWQQHFDNLSPYQEIISSYETPLNDSI